MKSTPQGINSELDDAEEWISNLEGGGRIVEITELEQQKETEF